MERSSFRISEGPVCWIWADSDVLHYSPGGCLLVHEQKQTNNIHVFWKAWNIKKWRDFWIKSSFQEVEVSYTHTHTNVMVLLENAEPWRTRLLAAEMQPLKDAASESERHAPRELSVCHWVMQMQDWCRWPSSVVVEKHNYKVCHLTPSHPASSSFQIFSASRDRREELSQLESELVSWYRKENKWKPKIAG